MSFLYVWCHFIKATNSSFQKGMTFCRSIYVKKVMKLLAFIFEQPSYLHIQLEGIQLNDSTIFNNKLTCLRNKPLKMHVLILL